MGTVGVIVVLVLIVALFFYIFESEPAVKRQEVLDILSDRAGFLVPLVTRTLNDNRRLANPTSREVSEEQIQKLLEEMVREGLVERHLVPPQNPQNPTPAGKVEYAYSKIPQKT